MTLMARMLLLCLVPTYISEATRGIPVGSSDS